jgi:hypothetical protein
MNMNGETNLETLLKSMTPVLHQGEYVFCSFETIPETIATEEVILFFREAEGITLVVNRLTADQLKLDYSFVAAWITLTVHSSLEAVGLTAAFSNALAREGISCNVVAGFYHDHLFVKYTDAHKAMTVLNKMSC